MTEPRPSDAGDGRDPFILAYNASELSIAAEFLATWLPFLSRDLCPSCTHFLSQRVRSLEPGSSFGASDAREPCDDDACGVQDTAHESPETPGSHDNFDTNSLGSWKDSTNDFSEPLDVATPSGLIVATVPVRMSWADMAQEDELEEERAETEPPVRTNENEIDNNDEAKKKQKSSLPTDQREYIRFMNVQRKKDFICLERVKGKFVNILEGLELHTGIFSAAEQNRIVECVYDLQDNGRKGKLRARTYSEPKKWMRGKGRVTIQFGCCYNYAVDENGNPPGILRNDIVDPIPHLFKVMIKRMVGWHVLPPSCVPDSCIVNIYEPGDCIPPHIDNHDFVRPFCTVFFLSECDILFGSNLRIADAGEFSGSFAIPLPVGSVLVLNGNGADVAKHCVPAVPTKRISITFRKMDESKQPFGFVADPDLLGIQPTKFDNKVSRSWRSSKPLGIENRRASVEVGRELDREPSNRSFRSQRNRSGRNKSRTSNNHREVE